MSSRTRARRLLAALAVAGLLLPPAFAAGTGPAAPKRRPPAISISLDNVSSFTPANADPRLAAAFAGRAPSAADFKFTPAANKSRPSQLRVAIRARTSTPASAPRIGDAAETSASPVSALNPTSYNLGAAIGWRRFAVTGDVAKVKGNNATLGGREGAVVGVNYSLSRFTGRVAVGADRGDGEQAPVLADTRAYSLDVGGAYKLTRSLAVTGGVRYKVERDRATTLADQRRDSQAVYVGTAFRF